MPEQSVHPSPEELGAYSLGQLPLDQAGVIESHISECEPCCKTIVSLSSDDTFVALLQEARRLPADQTVDQDGVSANPFPTLNDVPAPLADHSRYEILGLIGQGGMGDVYKARHRMMDRTVALKIINRELVRKSEAVDRFHREVKTAARLSHPNIVTAYDAEQAGDVHFLVMEYVDGVDLSRLVKNQGKLPTAKACDYVRQAAIGLQHAHEMGMVHRDIKPHNLMVTPDGIVKILDFGLASLAPAALSAPEIVEVDNHLTAAGSIMGTPDFISPEQAHDAHQADIRSDIYSLGTTLYYLLSGCPPFAEGSVMHKLKSHAQAEPEPIQNIPDELADVLRRMMAKDPEERFQTPAEVAEALARFAKRDHNATGLSEKDPSQPKSQRESGGPRRLRQRLAIAAVTLLFAGIIYVVTDNGTVVIETEDENVEIAIRPLVHESHEGDRHLFSWQYRVGDTVTGSSVKQLRSGAYIIDLKGRENEFELSQNRFVLKRGGKVVVRVTRRDNSSKPIPTQTIKPDSIVTVVKPARVIRHKGTYMTLTYLPDGNLVTSDYNEQSNTRALYFLDDSVTHAKDGVAAGTKDVSQLVASRDGKWLAIASRTDEKVYLWNAQQRKLVDEFDTGGLIHGVSLSPDGKLLAAASWDGSAKVWDIESRELIRELGGYGRVHRVLFSPDGSRLAVSETPSGRTDLYETNAWTKQASFKHDYGVGQMAFSPNGKRIATGGNGLKGSEPWKMWVKVWDTSSGDLLMTFKEMQNAVSAVAFSPDSRYLIAVGGNWGEDSKWGGHPHAAEPIRIWDTKSQQLVATIEGHETCIRDISVSPNRRQFATGSYDGVVKVWNLKECVQESPDN